MTLFAVSHGTGGAHEHDAVYSIWFTKKAAFSERDRLREMEVKAFGAYARDEWTVFTVTVEQPCDEPVNWAPVEVERDEEVAMDVKP